MKQINFLSHFIGLSIVLFAASCQSPQLRAPDNVYLKYDDSKKMMLKIAVDRGVLFSLPENLTEDASSIEVSVTCRKVGEPTWIKHLFEYLAEFKKNPDLYEKFHVLSLKRGDKSAVEIHDDLDGARTLEITYVKMEERKEIQSLTDIPCSTSSMELIGQTVREIKFKYPNFTDVFKVLQNQNQRPNVARLNIDKSFMKYMADRLTIFRFSSELSFEMNSKGTSLLNSFTNSMASQMKKTPMKELDFWLAEMSTKGFATQNLKVFTLRKDIELSHGINIENAEKFARRTEEFGFPTPFISYRTEQGDFKFTAISSMEKCLSQMRGKYTRFMASTGEQFNTDSKFFLYPGYQCR